jgi:DNA-binding transcriptional MerR regulator
MKIGELSRRSGVSIRMLRYYEAEGLLRPARTNSDYRDYDASSEETLQRIGLLREAGLTLKAIRQLLPCLRSNVPEFEPCDALRAGLRHEVQQINRRIETLRRSQKLLAGFLNGLDDAPD